MKFGIVLPSYITTKERKRLADNTFAGLIMTKKPIAVPKLLLLLRPYEYVYPIDDLREKMEVEVAEPEGVYGTEFTLAWGTEKVLEDPSITHIIWMGDDALFNSSWLQVLEQLIVARPEARSWSVYRSAYEEVHKTLGEQDGYCLVRSICGHGLTFSREEFEAWKQCRHVPDSWHCTQGNTLDLCHVHSRPGNRWVTNASFIEHTGLSGVHCSPAVPEHAIAFQNG